MALTFQPLLGFANPDVPTLKHGLAEFPEPGLADFVIHQTSDRVIIDWESFSIATGESTRFVQPGSGSAALNRVTSGAPSELHGALSANGRVLLINPNGILIGPGGRIDTAGFLASTLDLSDADFLAGGDLHFAGDSIASVVNFGTITSIDGGDIFLIGKQVENHGSLTASEGSVGLAGASEVTILASGEERIMIEPDGLSGSVTNSGAIAAATAELRAAGGNEYALALNNTGMVRARSIENRGGRVILSVGGGGGRLVNDGEVRASNSVTVTHSGEAGSDGGVEIGGTVVARDETTGNGGAIVVSGPQVNIGTGGVLDASGSEAGTILITGEDAVTIDGSLAANGEAGNGGVIQVLGGDAGSVTVGGTVEAKGSADGGVIIFDAPTLTLNATSRIDASGAVNGGSIQVIGGDEGTVRVDGQLNASGGSGDGGSILLSGGDVALAASGGLDASGGADGGYIQIESAGSTVVEGSVRAVGGNGSGGRVEVLGETVSLGATALIDASGASGGGAVFVGGGREGGDASLRNANNTTVANGARIVANATGSGDGGTVILWADEAMDFRGAVENRGAGDGLGGFTEVSGLQQLGFNGTVDTGGGDLLLDPFNYVIGATEAANLAFLLGLNHITINTTMASPTFGSGAGPADPGEDGDITVNANVFYDSTFDLTLLAQGDVKFNASVQNRNASGGDINIVAGWDGTTAFNAAAFAGEDVGVTTVFGNGAGSILIGDGTQIGGVAVGSRSGTTRAFGHDVTLQGSDTTNYAFSHLGFQVSNGIAQDGTNLGIAPVVDGAITIHAKHDLRASGGGKLQTYAQVGHVGADYSNDATIEATATSVIEVATGNDIIFLGGGLDSYGQYAQLGQGGGSAAGSFSGATTITTANNIIFSGGGDLAYAQLGQGGYFALGNHDGTTTIITANDVTFTGGGGYHPFQVGRYAYAQLGQGGMFAYGNHSGTTTITSANHISFSGGDGEQAYAQLGQGGRGAIGNHDGTTTITTASDIRFSGGGGNSSHAQLGQGGVSGSHSGLIDVTHRGDLILAGQNVSSQYALIGHGDGPGDTDAGHTVDGVITIDTGGNVTVTNGWLGHLLDADGASNSGDMTVTANGDITLNSHVNQGGYDTASTYSYLAGGDVNFHASVQNRNAGGGDINIVAGRDGTTPFDAAAFTAEDVNAAATLFGNNSKSIHIGDGAQTTGIAVGSRSGTTRAFGHDVVLHGSNTTSNAFAQLGFQVTDGIAQDGTNLGIAPLVDGAITVHAKHDLSATAGNLTRVAYVQVGHVGADIAGGTTVEATASSVIEVAAGNDIVFLGDGVGGYAQLGQGGYLARGNHSGTTTITTANDIIFSGGDGFSYAQLGQGGFSAVGNHSGMITITDANDLIFSGGGGSRAYAQLGHGGVSSSGDQSGAIVAGLAGNLLLKSGSGSQAYAMIGHGDAGASTIGNRMGNIDLRVAGESSLVNNADTSNHRIWMIGHRSTGIVSMADILFLTGTLDYDDTAVAPNTTLGQDFADKFATNLAGGNVTIGSTGAVMGNSMEVNGVFDLRFKSEVQR